MARQGVRYHALADLDVMDPEMMTPVPRDGATICDVLLSGILILKLYL